ncbi:MAG: alpha/beta hydrolase, partial [Myxococcota bacterium]
MRKPLFIAFGVLLSAAVVLALGPTIRVDLSERPKIPRSLPGSLENLEAALAAHESGPIVDGAEKRILFHNGKQRTKTVLVYLHGFSASRQEIAPFVETLSQRLGANAFETRLAG